MYTVRTVYEPIRVQAVKTLPCPECGKRLRRQRTFQNTINPLNRNPDGTVRTRREVVANVRRLADEWKAQPEPCAGHKESIGRKVDV